MSEENCMTGNCPHCETEIRVIGCRTCIHKYRNFNNYPEAKECWECDMFHKNYVKEENE